MGNDLGLVVLIERPRYCIGAARFSFEYSVVARVAIGKGLTFLAASHFLRIEKWEAARSRGVVYDLVMRASGQ